MYNYLLELAQYVGVLVALAIIADYMIPRCFHNRFANYLTYYRGVITNNQINYFASTAAIFWLKKYNKFYGTIVFGIQQWIISSFMVLIYCILFSIIETISGNDSSITKQLSFWFIPSLLADVFSVNVTRLILKKIAKTPGRYSVYVVWDILLFVLFYYISFSGAIVKLHVVDDYSLQREMLHPFYIMWYALFRHYACYGASSISNKLVFAMALTTSVPTLLHMVYILFILLSKALLPYLTMITDFLIRRIIEKITPKPHEIAPERHAISVAIIVFGIALLPLLTAYRIISFQLPAGHWVQECPWDQVD